MSYEICVIGNETLLFPFLQFGFETYSPKNEEELRDYVVEIAKKNYGIIYIEDYYAEMIRDVLHRYRDQLTPIFIPIGEDDDGVSYSGKIVQEMMERAIGRNVL